MSRGAGAAARRGGARGCAAPASAWRCSSIRIRAQIEAAAPIGAPVIELHTGAYADSHGRARRPRELERLRSAARLARGLGLEVHAGHGLNYHNVQPVAAHRPRSSSSTSATRSSRARCSTAARRRCAR